MAVSHTGYVYGVFASSLVCVAIVIVAMATGNWIESTATESGVENSTPSSIHYGLFGGQLTINNLATPTVNTLYNKCPPYFVGCLQKVFSQRVTCVFEVNACAISCKTTAEAREEEVRALANKQRPSPACVATTTIDTSSTLDEPAVISSSFYLAVVSLLFIYLAISITSAVLAIVNATKNPTEPIFGIPGIIYSNIICSVLGVTLLLMFGIYWATSGLQTHLAISYVALGQLVPSPQLGFTYWLLILSTFCSLTNIGLVEYRKYVLERDRPPPTIKVENHSDGTIFLY